MSDELESAAKIGGGALFGTLLPFFIRRLFAKSDQESEHVKKALDSHRDQLETLKQKVVELDTRLGMREGRYGVEPLTTPGKPPSAALAEYRAKMSREGGDGQP